MPLLLTGHHEPFTVKVEYVKNRIGNTTSVTIPIDVWNTLINRYRDIFVNEDFESDTPPTENPAADFIRTIL